ncbi:hypothetical protein NE237_018612 [Protea cynaroides]|uniref:Uncharacterized protein n=1 Tax=Protea cynaroides TaxID=273540 RepID=A0A9Q0QP65_9MAGN|nr:hypothetical protein NE237_018612 [Protea cynaroides]
MLDVSAGETPLTEFLDAPTALVASIGDAEVPLDEYHEDLCQCPAYACGSPCGHVELVRSFRKSRRREDIRLRHWQMWPSEKYPIGWQRRALVLILIALCVLQSLVTAAHDVKKPFVIIGKVYCDTCRCGYKTPTTTYILGMGNWGSLGPVKWFHELKGRDGQLGHLTAMLAKVEKRVGRRRKWGIIDQVPNQSSTGRSLHFVVASVLSLETIFDNGDLGSDTPDPVLVREWKGILPGEGHSTK